MKKLILFLTILSLTAGFYSCKTTEANYRNAYETAKTKRTQTGDSVTTEALIDQQRPKPITVDGVTMNVRTEYVRPADRAQASLLKKYCVVVGRFRQIFNANSMAKRLVEGGYPNAFVVRNGMDEHYVVAASTAIPAEAAAMIERIQNDRSLTLHSPYPYVLRPAQLAR